jgi:hypothetical protein
MRGKILSALLLLSLAGRAEAREWEASGGAAYHYLRSPGVDAAAASDSVTFGELGFAVEVLDGVPFVDFVSAEARWQSGSTSANDFGLYRTTLSLDHLELGLRATREVYSRVRTFAHLDAGAVRGRLEIGTLDSVGTAISDTDWAFSGSAGLGVDVALYQQAASDPHPDFGLGVRLELGYQVTGAMSFVAHPERPPSEGAPLTSAEAPLGDLGGEGPVIRVGLFGRW